MNVKTMAPVNLDFVLLRFRDGAVVDKRTCPLGIQARGHWHRLDGVFAVGEPNTACVCTMNAVTPECKSGATVDQAAGLLAASDPTN